MKSQGPRGTADEWRARYAAADRDIGESQVELRRLQGQLEQQAGKTTSWNLGAPGNVSGESGRCSDELQPESADANSEGKD